MKRRRPLGNVKLVKPTHAPYGLGDGTPDSCPVPPGAKRRIALCQKLGKPGDVISQPYLACNVLRSTVQADRESIHTLHLDAQNRLIGVEEVAKGTLS